MTPNDFFDLLFEPREGICWGHTKFDTAVPCRFLYDRVVPDSQFFSINPLVNSRLDINVTAYRNILIEIDSVSLEEQKKILEKVPHSTLVYSGGKSYHAIISLQEPLKTRDEYNDLVKAVYAKIPEADKTAKNPSRFSRNPAGKRNGVEQKLEYVGYRIPLNLLCMWAGVEQDKLGVRTVDISYTATHKLLPVRAEAFLKHGAAIGRWNSALFIAACDMFSVGFTKEEVIEQCTNITGLLTNEDRRTIESARKNVYSAR